MKNHPRGTIVVLALAVVLMSILAPPKSSRANAPGNRIYLPLIAGGRSGVGTLYVAKNGNDAWSGKLVQPNSRRTDGPFLTVQQAVNTARPGDVIIVKPGVYQERVEIGGGGQPEQPVIIQGERGAVIDGGTRFKGWVRAPEIGPGVYKNQLSFAPAHMAWNDQHGVLIKPELMANGSFKGLITNGPDNTWAFVGALFGTLGETTYVKLAGGVDPNTQSVSFSPIWSGPIVLNGAQHVIIRGLTLKNGYNAILATQNAAFNTIEENTLIGGRFTVGLTFGASDTVIRDNTITLGYPVDLSPFEQYGDEIWHLFRVLSDGPRYAVGGYRAGDNIEIADNVITQHFVGIGYDDGRERPEQATGARHWHVHNNTIYDLNHVGITVGGGAVNHSIHDNRVWNTLQALRFQDPTTGPIYIYRNTFAMGNERYFKNAPDYPDSHHAMFYNFRPTLARIFVYHNTFSGAHAMTFQSANDANPDAPSITSSPNMYWINNIFSTEVFGVPPTASWFENNLMTPSRGMSQTNQALVAPLWTDFDLDLRLKSGSPALGIGADVSRAFTVGGKTIGPLPGFERGYFDGKQPDAGAYQRANR